MFADTAFDWTGWLILGIVLGTTITVSLGISVYCFLRAYAARHAPQRSTYSDPQPTPPKHDTSTMWGDD